MTARRAGAVALAAVALVGVGALYDALGWPVLVAAGAVAALALIGPVRRIVYWPGAAAVPVLALVGFNVLWEAVELPRLGLAVGLAVAVVVFFLAVLAYLALRVRLRWAVVAGLGLALAVVLGAPIVLGQPQVARDEVPVARPVASQLDVLLVVAGEEATGVARIPRDPALPSWDIRYSVARAEGEDLRWALLDSDSPEAARRAAAGRGSPVRGRPTLRAGADRALVLVVDGTPPVVIDPAGLDSVDGRDGEVDRWQRLARLAAPRGTPTFALLQTTDEGRLARWREWLREPAGDVASVQRLGSQAITDTAVNLAASAPTAREDMALGFKHRPVLLFDATEPVATPLEIETFFASGRVRLCREEVTATTCEDVRRSSQLVNGATHLRLDLPRPRSRRRRRLAPSREVGARAGPERRAVVGPLGPAPGTASTVYVHVVPVERGRRRLVYLDYWWYLPFNPAGSGRGSFCGAGLVIPGKTCFDHQSDWEGMTVVVDRTGREPEPVAVQYAEHGDVVSHRWEDLRRLWRGRAYRRLVRRLDDADDRPLAFVARGTHASYPGICARGCRQAAHRNREEGVHRGDDPWPGNDTALCTAAVCLKPLPTRGRGTAPALWNAFEGTWGTRNCIWIYYCDADSAPSAPARQGRYRRPWEIDGSVDARGRFRRADPGG